MTQEQIKQMASEMVGDGGTPNLWFVTIGPYVDDGELIEGYDPQRDVTTYGPFTTYEAAVKQYEEIDLDVNYGMGQVFIEDRQCGVVRERWLNKRIAVEWVEDELDNSKLFYK